jgi:outer membrane protein assembly factor BamB
VLLTRLIIRISAIVILISAATFAGCNGHLADSNLGANSRLNSNSAAPSAGQLAGWPALPVDKYVDPSTIRAKRSAAVSVISLPGSNAMSYLQNRGHIDATEMTCTLEPGPNDLSWAVYQFSNLLPEDLPLVASVRFTGELPPGPCFIGLSDYAKGTWRWVENLATLGDFNIAVGADEQPISAGGNAYVVIGAWDRVALSIREAALQLDAAAPPPLGFNVDDGDGEAVATHLSWIDPAVSFDPDGAGPQQYSYDGIEIQRAPSPLGPWSSSAILQPAVTSFDDPDTLGVQPGAPCTYYYEIRTLKQSVLSPWGPILLGNVNLAVNELTANLVLSPGIGSAGAHITLDGTSSVHSGALSTVALDFDGNGTWDKTITPALTFTNVYGSAARYYPRLKLVMDIGGGSTLTDIVTTYLPIGDARGDWSQYGRNALHNGRSPLRGPRTGAIRKTYSTASTAFYEPSIGADGSVYVCGSDGYLYILSADLSFKDKVNLKGGTTSTPAITKSGYIWLAVNDSMFHRTLTCVWPDHTVHSYPPLLMEGEPVVSADGQYVIAAYENELYCALPVPPGGSPTWYTWKYTVPSPEYIKTPAIASDGSICFSTDFFVYKLSSAGALLYKQAIGGIMGTPAIATDGKFYLSYGFTLMAFDGYCSNLWQTFGPDGYDLVGAPAIGPDGNIYVCSAHGGVAAFAPLGYPLYPYFTAPGETFITGPVIDGNGRVYLLAASGTVYCLTKKLALTWSYPIGAACSQGTLAMGNNGTLYAGGSTLLTSFK